MEFNLNSLIQFGPKKNIELNSEIFGLEKKEVNRIAGQTLTQLILCEFIID